MATESDTTRFKVSGNCEMCKETIEEAVDVKGVSFAEWNEETGMMTVVYNPEKINESRIHTLISEAGYDTDKVKAKQEVYDDLPKCCKYRKTK